MIYCTTVGWLNILLVEYLCSLEFAHLVLAHIDVSLIAGDKIRGMAFTSHMHLWLMKEYVLR